MYNPMKILIKFPTRGRREMFFKTLDLYYKNLHDLDNTRFIITCDEDDESMNNDEVKQKFLKYKNLEFYYGKSKTKIEAINNDIYDENFDIILLASDDMIPQVIGYDDVIRFNMANHFPDTDGILWFFDGYRKDLNTLCILGKKYYKRFNYIYNPEYTSFYADNEFMLVGNILQKQKYFDFCIIKHLHPDITNELIVGYDETYKKNNISGDDIVFIKRKNKNFYL